MTDTSSGYSGMGAGAGSSAERTVTAMYDTRGAAETARDGLVSLGVSSGDVSIRGSEGSSSTSSSSTSSATSDEGKGFWGELKDLFVPDEDRHTYAEGMRRGGYLLTARVREDMIDPALDVLEQAGPIDMDERSQNWSSEGWSREGYRDYSQTATSQSASGMAAGAGLTGAGSGMAGTTTTGYTDTTTTSTRGTSDLGAARVDTDRDVIERAEERIRVGKREVGRGSVRVRSYVVETPVEEQVTLNSERVHVERHAVDRPVRAGDGVFEERVIEATERSEEAVVSKEARVVEEIGLRKEADSRTETIRDTVRRQEVEVEDGPTTRGASTTSGLTGGVKTGTTTTTTRTEIEGEGVIDPDSPSTTTRRGGI